MAQSEEQVKCVNRELSGQMAEMVREFDEDKKQALQKYVYLLFIINRYVSKTFVPCISVLVIDNQQEQNLYRVIPTKVAPLVYVLTNYMCN